MKGLLVRVGIDQSYGGWNAPCRVDGSFCYVPMQPIIPEVFDNGFQTTYDEFDNVCQLFAQGNAFAFPAWLRHAPCHLDPDFSFLTYGDGGQRANRISTFFEGSEDNFIAFYASFTPIENNEQSLVYAIIGLYKFQNVGLANAVPEHQRNQNAHTRLTGYAQGNDIVIFADQNTSGRLSLLMPIGEYRNRAYRVRQDLLQQWGGISSRDGYIQRSVYLPHFCDAERFLQWFNNQNPVFVAQNNIVY